jgi:transposase
MRQKTFMFQVTVISQCVQGNLTCARAAELLDLSPRHVKRLKSRYWQGSAAALAHVSRGRPSPRRTPQAVRKRALALVRMRYADFNDHHLHVSDSLPKGRTVAW